jgi:DNA-binding FrmR family transcriptional regulator
MKVHSQAVKDDLHRRLRRIEGQVRGVQRMVDEERECEEIVQQLNAINSAVRNATHTFMRAYAKDCLFRARELDTEGEEMLDELLDLMAKVK